MLRTALTPQSDGADTYTTDALGRVVRNGSTAFDYSGTGNTLSYDGGTVYSRDPAGGLVADQQTAGSGSFDLTDQHTDLVGYLNPATGALSGSAAYDPLGQSLAKTGHQTNLGYQSEYTGPATGKVDMAARWYNPATGQFTSKDTVANSPVPTSANANPFAYANEDPLTATDPTGHTKCDIEPDLCAQTAPAKAAEHREAQPSPCSNPNFPGCSTATTKTTTPTKPTRKPNVVSDAKATGITCTSYMASQAGCTAGQQIVSAPTAPSGGCSLGCRTALIWFGVGACSFFSAGTLAAECTVAALATQSQVTYSYYANSGDKNASSDTQRDMVDTIAILPAGGVGDGAIGDGAAGDGESAVLGAGGADALSSSIDSTSTDGQEIAAAKRAGQQAARRDADSTPPPGTPKPGGSTPDDPPVKAPDQSTPTKARSGGGTGSTNVDTQPATPVTRSVSTADAAEISSSTQPQPLRLSEDVIAPQKSLGTTAETRAVPEGASWTVYSRLGDASDWLHEHLGNVTRSLGANNRLMRATWSAGVNTDTGEIGIAASGCGTYVCAEPNLVQALGGDPSRIRFTLSWSFESISPEAGSPMNWMPKGICGYCQPWYARDRFSIGTPHYPGYAWDNGKS